MEVLVNIDVDIPVDIPVVVCWIVGMALVFVSDDCAIKARYSSCVNCPSCTPLDGAWGGSGGRWMESSLTFTPRFCKVFIQESESIVDKLAYKI